MKEESVFQFLVWIQFVRAALSFRRPVGIQTYGRHLAPRLSAMPTLPSHLGWLLMEAPTLLVPALIFHRGKHAAAAAPRLLLLLFLAHYFHRTLLYPLRLSRRSSSSTPMPLVTAVLAALFNALNTYIQLRWISHFGFYPERWIHSAQFAIGAFLFVAGMAINIWADGVLIALRKQRSSAKESVSYRVPYGGLYEFVSCPNYLGEIVEWLGWAILTWSPAGLGFFLYTVATLAPRACAHHRWYVDKFPDYPRGRTPLIPFLC
ncbi:steroid 5-alpha-reductase DET2 [Selaginella moellendorffii]|nr:steroid 5-alpha-reductase DET2 [Selaginella moellendorffii]|eukprot:XP_002981079.2 steroid 5-alpha-reductase DET2 [Selaginella moellendorffii]